MKHILFSQSTLNLKVAILVKTMALNKTKIDRYYISPHPNLKSENFVALDLWYNDKKKAPAAQAREYLAELLPEIDDLGINTVMVCDTPYFKLLTGKAKADPYYGYVLPCVVKGYEHLDIVISPNYQAMMYKPDLQVKIDRAIETIDKLLLGIYSEPGKDIIDYSYYPDTPEKIEKALQDLSLYPELTCDIEALSLEFWSAGISTIAFAWDKHNGMAFAVDRAPIDVPTQNGWIARWRPEFETRKIRSALLKFLCTYKGKLTYHNISYDGKVLVYDLFMKHLADYKGMIEGIKCVTKDFDDTKLIAYMATNNAVRNELGLKAQSCEFTGNYAQDDIQDTSKIPIPDLLEYNLKDCLATWFVKQKHWQTMVNDEQLELYEGLIKESIPTLMQTELCGMPIDPGRVSLAKAKLTDISNRCHDFFKNCQFIQDFHMDRLRAKADKKTREAAAKAKTDRATKVYTWEDSVIYEEFNPGSNNQLSALLYDYLGYPVLDLTDNKAPSTGKKTLAKLINHARCPEHKEMFEKLIELSGASIILSTFIPAFENAQQLPDGSWRLYGNFNLGGTQSLRLSSSNP